MMIPYTNTQTFIYVRISQNSFFYECEVRAD